MNIQRFGAIIGLRPEMEARYRELHSAVWPSILARLKASNIRNYSIYIAEIEGRKFLFSYLEYIGDDYQGDMKAIADDPQTQLWWRETDPCQTPLADKNAGDRKSVV